MYIHIVYRTLVQAKSPPFAFDAPISRCVRTASSPVSRKPITTMSSWENRSKVESSTVE